MLRMNTDQIASATAQLVSPVYQSQMIAGSRIGSVPTCDTDSTKAAMVSTATNGMPETANPMAAMTDCTTAVTTTPRATPRMARPATSSARSPRSPPRRSRNRSTPSRAASPCWYMMVTMTSVSSDCRSSMPRLPALVVTQPRAPPT